MLKVWERLIGGCGASIPILPACSGNPSLCSFDSKLGIETEIGAERTGAVEERVAMRVMRTAVEERMLGE